MGKALEAFNVHYNRGADAVIKAGNTKDAMAKAVLVSKAIGMAKRKLTGIKNKTEKRDAEQLLDAYEKEIAGFNDELLTAGYTALCGDVIEVIVRQFKDEGIDKLKDVQKLVDLANASLKKGDASSAVKNHGAALNKLKGVTGIATKSGLVKQAASYAKAKGVAPKDVDLSDSRIKSAFAKVSKSYNEISQELADMDDEIEKLEDQLANKEPETDPSATAEYKKNMKQLMKLYMGVVSDAKKDLAKVKKSSNDISKLTRILSKTVPGNADALVQAVLKVFKGLKSNYSSIDSNIQKTIRTDKSTYNLKAKEWGITPADKGKNTMPLMNRAFALNYQAKSLYETGTDKLIDILDALEQDHGSALAKRAAAELRKS